MDLNTLTKSNRSEKECLQTEKEKNARKERRSGKRMESQKDKPEGTSSLVHIDCHWLDTTKGKMDGAFMELSSILVVVVHLMHALQLGIFQSRYKVFY